MALSAEMQAFVDATSVFNRSASNSLANISADVQKLLAGAGSSMSQEDKDALDALVSITSQLTSLSESLAAQADVVPE